VRIPKALLQVACTSVSVVMTFRRLEKSFGSQKARENIPGKILLVWLVCRKDDAKDVGVCCGSGGRKRAESKFREEASGRKKRKHTVVCKRYVYPTLRAQ
jgi:hypothetical protein